MDECGLTLETHQKWSGIKEICVMQVLLKVVFLKNNKSIAELCPYTSYCSGELIIIIAHV